MLSLLWFKARIMWSGKDLRFGMMSVVVALDLALLWCEGGKCMSEIGKMREGRSEGPVLDVEDAWCGISVFVPCSYVV